MTSNFKLEMQLEQYTPLLHFQGEQAGACLRATEVKPKLDRFVLEYVQRKGITLPDTWFAKKADEKEQLISRSALQYKLRFEAIGNGNPRKIERGMSEAALYFGFTGKKDSFSMRSVFYNDGINMTILCFIPELIELLMKLVVPFFAMHCFGTRSNKGFGSFGIKKFTIVPQELEPPSIEVTPEQLSEYLPDGVPALYAGKFANTRPDKGGNIYANILFCIASISSMMKGGINFTERNGTEHYFRGSVITYCGERYHAHSEKAMIKRDLLQSRKEDMAVQERLKAKKKTWQPAQQGERCLYHRGVLGLAQTYTYKDDRSKGIYRKGTIKIEGTAKESKDKKSVIQRFENPVHFKPHGQWLLLIPQEYPAALHDEKLRQFTFEVYGKTETISLPKHFDLDAFLRYYSDIYNRRDEIAQENTELGAQMKSILTFNGGPFHMKDTFVSLKTLNRYEKKGGSV